MRDKEAGKVIKSPPTTAIHLAPCAGQDWCEIPSQIDTTLARLVAQLLLPD